MAGQGQDGANIDWAKFERYFQQLFPSALPRANPEWMKTMMDDSMNQSLGHLASANSARQTEVFETHRQVIVRVSVRDPELLDRIRIRMGEQRLLLEGLAQQQMRIPLPAAVKPRTSRAVYREGILQITALKRKPDAHDFEVPISY